MTDAKQRPSNHVIQGEWHMAQHICLILLIETHLHNNKYNLCLNCKPDACSEEVVHGDFWGSLQIWKLQICIF